MDVFPTFIFNQENYFYLTNYLNIKEPEVKWKVKCWPSFYILMIFVKYLNYCSLFC